MFLKKLYKSNKIIFACFCLFVVVQLFLNFKRGLTATPFMHYGMYSGYTPAPTYIDVWDVEVDSKKLSMVDFSAKVSDCIIQPLIVYEQLPYSNSLYHSHIKHYLRYLPKHDSSAFLNRVSKDDFTNWYKKNLGKIIRKEINELRVYKSSYEVDGSKLSLKNKSLVYYDLK